MKQKYKWLKQYRSQLYIVAIISVTVLTGILFYVLNYYTPLFADDYSYSFSYSTGERITGVDQIIDSQVAHYQKVNGRSVVHFLAQLFLLIGDKAFNVINTVFFLALLFLIYFHACGSFKNFSLARFSVIAVLLFLSCPSFGQSFLWITGASNYMYGMLIILTFLLPYRKQVEKGSTRYPVPAEIIMGVVCLLSGMIAGWTNENTSVAMIAIIIAYLAYFKIKSVRIHAWNFTGLAGGIVGCVMMLSSGGTAGRLDSAGGSGGILSWLKRAVFYTFDLITNLPFVILLFSVLLILYLYQKRHLIKKSSFRQAVENFSDSGVTLIYFFGFFVSVYSMVVSPQFPGRVWSGPVILSLIAVMHLSAAVDMSDIKIRAGKAVAVSFLSVLFISTFVTAFYDVKNVYVSYLERTSTIETAIADGKKSVDIPEIYGWTGYSCYEAVGDLNDDSREWPNRAIAEYYNLDEIVSGG